MGMPASGYLFPRFWLNQRVSGSVNNIRYSSLLQRLLIVIKPLTSIDTLGKVQNDPQNYIQSIQYHAYLPHGDCLVRHPLFDTFLARVAGQTQT